MTATTIEHTLPDGTEAWIESITGEQLTGLSRHVARREAWVVDTQTSAGEAGQYFLRIDRNGIKGHGGPWSLERETAIIQSLMPTPVPVQRIVGWNGDLHLALQQMVPGDGELNLVPREQQHAVFADFCEALAHLHKLDPRALGLEDHCQWPQDAAAHALGEVRIIEKLWQRMPEPAEVGSLFTAFGKRWLENHVPAQTPHTVLVQGDTGPANFMFEGNAVTAFVDWEWAHIGDPMEDWGNIVVRDFFYPSSGGDMREYFALYEQHSGIEVDVEKVKYYTVQQLLRSVMSLLYTVRTLHWRDEVAMNMGYEMNCQRAMCDAIARAMGVDNAVASLPDSCLDSSGSASGDAMQRVLANSQAIVGEQLLPAQDDRYLTHRANSVNEMLEYGLRLQRYGAGLDALECQAIEDLLGQGFGSLPAAEQALRERIDNMEGRDDELAILRYLQQRAYRLEELMEPLLRRFANRSLARVD